MPIRHKLVFTVDIRPGRRPPLRAARIVTFKAPEMFQPTRVRMEFSPTARLTDIKQLAEFYDFTLRVKGGEVARLPLYAVPSTRFFDRPADIDYDELAPVFTTSRIRFGVAVSEAARFNLQQSHRRLTPRTRGGYGAQIILTVEGYLQNETARPTAPQEKEATQEPGPASTAGAHSPH